MGLWRSLAGSVLALSLHVGPSGLEKTELWTYEPWPFSFEVREDRVTSIRISDPPLK